MGRMERMFRSDEQRKYDDLLTKFVNEHYTNNDKIDQYIINEFGDVIQKHIRVEFCKKCNINYFHIYTLINGQNTCKVCIKCNEMSKYA